MKKVRSVISSVRNIQHFSMSEKVTVQVISVLSMISTMTTLLTFLIIFSSDQSWEDIRDFVLHWMTDNNINVNATRKVISVLSWMSDHSTLINSIFIILTMIHFIFSCLLYIGSSPARPRLRLPWLISHMIIIIITICWTFITFFIDLLVTIVFPVLSGLVLGVSILLWRLVHTIHNNYQGDTASDATNTSDIKIGWSWSLRGSSCDKSKLTEMS